MLEGVQVLDLGLGPEGRRAHRPDRDIGVAAQAPLLHVAVVDANRHQNLAQPAEELAGLGGRAQIRFGHDLEERDTAAIEVQVGPAVGIRKAFVQGLAGILFEVRPGDPDPPRLAGHLVLDAPAGGDGPFVLRDLISLREVRIEVILAREDRHRVDLAIEGVRDPDGEFHDLSVQHRQRARQPKAHGADIGVRWRPEPGAAAAEDLRLGQQLRVNLETNHGLERCRGLDAEC